MDLAVDQVLAERSERGRGPAVASVVGAIALHGLVVVAVIVVGRWASKPPPLDFVDVTVVPAAALGAPPAPPPTPTPPPPQPAAAPPEVATPAPVLPVEKPKPKPKPEPAKPEPPDNRFDPTTRPKLLPPPRELLAQRVHETPPTPAAPAPTGPPATRPGSATGTTSGTVQVGSSIATLDNPDFTYDYYTAQLLAAIDRAWTRPPVADGVHAIVSFHILRDGTISDLAVRETSGFNNFDLSALRAVQNAAPFPPLPRGYHHDWLGVNLMVR